MTRKHGRLLKEAAGGRPSRTLLELIVNQTDPTAEPELTGPQKAYNVAQYDLFQLAAYGHCTYTNGEMLTDEGRRKQSNYNDRIRAACEQLEATLLRLVAEKAESFRGDWGIPAAWLRSLADDPGAVSLLAVRPDELPDDAPAAVFPEPPSRAALSEAERTMLTYALNQAQEKIWSEDGFTDEDQAAVDSLRRLAAEAQQQETPSMRLAAASIRASIRDRDGAGAQQPETEARPVPLATPCILCQHPYNWHASRGVCEFGNEVNRCGCRAFAPGEKPAPVDPRTILGIDAPVEPAGGRQRGDARASRVRQLLPGDREPRHPVHGRPRPRQLGARARRLPTLLPAEAEQPARRARLAACVMPAAALYGPPGSYSPVNSLSR